MTSEHGYNDNYKQLETQSTNLRDVILLRHVPDNDYSEVELFVGYGRAPVNCYLVIAA